MTPELKEELFGKEVNHPSFVMAGFSRCSGSPDLVDCPIKVQSYITLRITKAVLKRSLNEDRYYGDSNIPMIEVCMSETQFARMLTNMNVGDGIPMTLHSLNGKDAPKPPVVNIEAPFKKDLEDHGSKLIAAAETAEKRIGELLDQPRLSVADKKEIRELLHATTRRFHDHLPFLFSQLKEQLMTRVDEAKNNVDAYVKHTLLRVGFEKLMGKSEPKPALPDHVVEEKP